jgi:hypothetical protein
MAKLDSRCQGGAERQGYRAGEPKDRFCRSPKRRMPRFCHQAKSQGHRPGLRRIDRPETE